jgi:hypothetical protein
MEMLEWLKKNVPDASNIVCATVCAHTSHDLAILRLWMSKYAKDTTSYFLILITK